MATDNNTRKKFWLLVDALAALADQTFDMIMLHEYAVNGDWHYFFIGLGTIVAPIVLTSCCCCMDAEVSFFSSFLDFVTDGCLSFLIMLVPGLNLLVLALGGVFMEGSKGEGVAIVYQNKRAFEAFFEAGPQAILQVFVALSRPEGIRIPILLASLGLSLFSLTKTLVAFFIFEDFSEVSYRQRNSRNDFPSHGARVRMFLLSFFYELFEVISKVSSVALLGYFCGGYSIAISFAAEYVFLYIYLRARGFRILTDAQGFPIDAEREGNWRYLLLPLTSFVGGRAVPFKYYLCLRLLILGAYVAAVFLFIQDEDDMGLDWLSEIFIWIAAVATGLWVLLIPALVNSCHNLGVAFYSWSEDRYVTDRLTKCPYPLEIKMDSRDDGRSGGIYSCLFSEKTVELVEEVTEVAVNAATVAVSVSG